jgi:hypothetical protein
VSRSSVSLSGGPLGATLAVVREGTPDTTGSASFEGLWTPESPREPMREGPPGALGARQRPAHTAEPCEVAALSP